ncbi:glycosyltransferase [Devosia sp.]|uniref:glycosyltransferase n=1 Tax=Devosia sp. TaxID=1871048 RepID=UPI003F721179
MKRTVRETEAVRMLLIGPVPPPTGGISVHLSRLSATLTKNGIPHSILDESKPQTVGVSNIRKMLPWTYVSTLRRHDLVHIHSFNHFARLMHTVVARVCGLQIVHTVHSARGSRLALLALRASSKLSQRTVCVSHAVAAVVGGATAVIPAFIAPSELDEPPLPEDVLSWLDAQRANGRRLIAANASKVSFFEGADLYGIDMIVEAFESAAISSRYSALICLSREGPAVDHLASLRRSIEQAGLEEIVKFVVGEVSFPAVLRRCDVFVRPTNTDGDAVSLREAQWYGKPCIASDAAVRPEGTILFRSRDVADFVSRLLGADAASPPSDRRDYAESIISVYDEALSA